MSLGNILSSATSALQASQTALKVTSNNISNVNTAGYNRRVVEFGPRLTDNWLTGVSVEDIKRMTDQYLDDASINASSQLSKVDVLTTYFDRIQDLVASLDGDSSLDERISSVMSSLTQLAADPSSQPRRASAVASITSALSAISGMSQQLQGLRQDANSQITTDIDNANTYIQQIYDLNVQVRRAQLAGDNASGLLDQRDRAISELSKFMDIRTLPQPDGRLFVALQDGTSIVSDTMGELRYTSPTTVTSATSFPSIYVQKVDPESGTDVGAPTAIESHLGGGELRGLLDMRDKVLPDLAEQLGALAGGFVEQLNAIHNDSSAVPPLATLTGRNTGLIGTDALNMTGHTTIALVDSTGALVQQVDLDFSTMPTIDDAVNAINGAFGGAVTASFVDGVMTVQATAAGTGVAFKQDDTNPSSRGGRSFAQTFGLNDLITSQTPSSYNTGMTLGDAHGFGGGQVDFTLRGPEGNIIRQFSYTAAGATVGDIINDLNTAANGTATFSLDANGQMIMTPAAQYAGARLEVGNDTTGRGTTGVTLSQFFGLGTAARMNQAQNLAIRSDIAASPSKMALAQLDITGASVAGDIVLGVSDNRGAQQLASIGDTSFAWPAAGGFSATNLSIRDFAARILGTQSDLANAASSEQTYRADVKDEVDSRRGSVESVNLDEELTNMMVYQQAYNAAARLLTTVQQLYDTLLQAV